MVDGNRGAYWMTLFKAPYPKGVKLNIQCIILALVGAAVRVQMEELTNSDPIGIFSGLLAVILGDVGLRFRNKEVANYWQLSPQAGGQLFQIPIWVIAAVLAIFAALSHFEVI